MVLAFEVSAIASLVSLGLPRQRAADPIAAAGAKEILRLIYLALLNRGIKATGILAVSTVVGEAEIDLLASETACRIGRVPAGDCGRSAGAPAGATGSGTAGLRGRSIWPFRPSPDLSPRRHSVSP